MSTSLCHYPNMFKRLLIYCTWNCHKTLICFTGQSLAQYLCDIENCGSICLPLSMTCVNGLDCRRLPFVQNYVMWLINMFSSHPVIGLLFFSLIINFIGLPVWLWHQSNHEKLVQIASSSSIFLDTAFIEICCEFLRLLGIWICIDAPWTICRWTEASSLEWYLCGVTLAWVAFLFILLPPHTNLSLLELGQVSAAFSVLPLTYWKLWSLLDKFIWRLCILCLAVCLEEKNLFWRKFYDGTQEICYVLFALQCCLPTPNQGPVDFSGCNCWKIIVGRFDIVQIRFSLPAAQAWWVLNEYVLFDGREVLISKPDHCNKSRQIH